MARTTVVGAAGADQLARLGARLKAEGGGRLRRELQSGLRAAAKPMIPEVRASALATLPASGGLAADIAGASYGIRTRLSGSGAGVRVVGTGRGSLRALDRGRLRHPVFGNRKAWVTQQVPPGFFTRPLADDAVGVRGELLKVMSGIANRVERY